jgi:metal-dependent hydrolase (beta-lactamase superfamily II)
MQRMPVEAWWTGHCTGHRAFGVLQAVLGTKLGEIHTGTALAV